MKIQYLSHSGFLITTDEGKRILIDPFLSGNPNAPVSAGDIYADYIILTHAHGDHRSDAFSIGRRCDSLFICVNELADYCHHNGYRAHNMHIGGAHKFPFGRVKFTIAHHGSITPDGRYAGAPAGVLLFIEGKVLYHAGDTGLFLDMKLIGELHAIDVACLPIGDNFTMGIDDAVKAVEFLRPKLTVPIHYNTFPVIQADPEEFKKKVQLAGGECRIMQFGEEIKL